MGEVSALGRKKKPGPQGAGNAPARSPPPHRKRGGRCHETNRKCGRHAVNLPFEVRRGPEGRDARPPEYGPCAPNGRAGDVAGSARAGRLDDAKHRACTADARGIGARRFGLSLQPASAFARSFGYRRRPQVRRLSIAPLPSPLSLKREPATSRPLMPPEGATNITTHPVLPVLPVLSSCACILLPIAAAAADTVATVFVPWVTPPSAMVS